jgi:hypothetical protein
MYSLMFQEPCLYEIFLYVPYMILLLIQHYKKMEKNVSLCSPQIMHCLKTKCFVFNNLLCAPYKGLSRQSVNNVSLSGWW